MTCSPGRSNVLAASKETILRGSLKKTLNFAYDQTPVFDKTLATDNFKHALPYHHSASFTLAYIRST